MQDKGRDMSQERIWAWSEISSIWERRFIHYKTAFEVFTTSGKSYFFNCFTEERQSLLLDLAGSCLGSKLIRILKCKDRYKHVERNCNLWGKNQLSNYTYLVFLNQLAGRSFNETSQYMVFPWILRHDVKEYRGNGKEVYRNLRENVGCQLEESKEEARKRYTLMGEAGMEPCHFGSHYSTSGVVSYYLIRLEPYVSAAITLQDNKFDVADRIFASVEAAWRGCLYNSGDFKELTPEFFTLPEVFINLNKYSFGLTQSKQRVDKVALPVWAEVEGEGEVITAYNFVRLHEKALESRYVGERLGLWVDLVFGWKQRGSRATEAINQFFPYTYSDEFKKAYAGAPEKNKEGMRQQVVYYGQTPLQIFTSGPHPMKASGDMQQRGSGVDVVPFEAAVLLAVVKIVLFEEKVGLILRNGTLKLVQKSSRNKEETVQLAPDFLANPKLIVVLQPYLIYPTRSSLSAYNLLSGQQLPLPPHHSLPLTTLYSAAPYLLQASEDCLLSLWSCVYTPGTRTTTAKDNIEQVRVYYGHRASVMDVYMDRKTGVVISVDRLGVVLIHSWEDGVVLGAIEREWGEGMRVAGSKDRLVALYFLLEGAVELYTFAGLPLRTHQLSYSDRFETITFTKSGEQLLLLGTTIKAWDPYSRRNTPARLLHVLGEEAGNITAAEYSGAMDSLAVILLSPSPSLVLLDCPYPSPPFLSHLPHSL